MYIAAFSAISPQESFQKHADPMQVKSYCSNRLACIEPNYTSWIDPKLIRRMSRLIRMGVTCALDALNQAKLTMPDAIITGTAYGCLEDTGIFLKRLIEHHEELLSPTAFIQSTHNTVSAQIALLLKCNAYNNTFVHGGFSFESAILDSMMLLQEPGTNHVLLGAVDETTDESFSILQRFGTYRKLAPDTSSMIQNPQKGTVAGEGAIFFVAQKKKSIHSKAKIIAIKTLFKPSLQELQTELSRFLKKNEMNASAIDILVSGRNGNQSQEKWCDLVRLAMPTATEMNFKHLCGEYPTAVAFGLWQAVHILSSHQSKAAPATKEANPKRLLLYNQFQGTHHSLILMESC